MTAEEARPPVVGVILAGGLARRMGGGDKCLQALGGQPILTRILGRLAPQVSKILLNANGDSRRFAAYDLPVAPDLVEGYAGPLAGVLTGLAWVKEQAPDCPWIVTVPGDGPFLPCDLVARFLGAIESEGAELACAVAEGRPNPVVGLWPVALFEELRQAVVEEGLRKVDVWTARHRLATVAWPTEPVDPFFNANKPEDLAEAERMLPLAP